jgi:hypothetical protein
MGDNKPDSYLNSLNPNDPFEARMLRAAKAARLIDTGEDYSLEKGLQKKKDLISALKTLLYYLQNGCGIELRGIIIPSQPEDINKMTFLQLAEIIVQVWKQIPPGSLDEVGEKRLLALASSIESEVQP